MNKIKSLKSRRKSHVNMGNTQGVWILCSIVLTLNFLIDEKQRAVAKRPGIERGAVEANQCTYFRNALTLKKLKNVFVKWKSKVLWRSSIVFVSTGNRGCGFVPA